MYTDADFCNYIQQAAGEQLLSAKAFAYCFIAADEEERQKRLGFLQAAACGDPHPADSSMQGKGLDPALFEQARARWESEWKADPKGFTDCALSGSLWQSAAVLRVRQLPRLRYVAEGLLPQGLVLLASPPKYGKSWLALDLCLSVASGKPFLGRTCQRGECLYLALEDGEQRLQSRMSRLLGDQPAPAGLFYQTKAVSLDNGLLTNLDFFAVKYPRARLIVIDTLQKIRGEERTSSSVYAADYAVMGQLKEFADRHGICLLLVHHLRKMSDDADPFNRIAGSNGIFGAADAAMVLARSKRSDPRTTLSLTGRDVEEQELILTFDKARCRWQVLGDADEVEAQDERAAYDADPGCQFNFTAAAYRDMLTALTHVSSRKWAASLPKDLPVLLVAGTDDPVGDYGSGVCEVYARLGDAGMQDLTCQIYEGGRHEMHNETNRAELFADELAWLDSRLFGGQGRPQDRPEE